MVMEVTREFPVIKPKLFELVGDRYEPFDVEKYFSNSQIFQQAEEKNPHLSQSVRAKVFKLTWMECCRYWREMFKGEK